MDKVFTGYRVINTFPEQASARLPSNSYRDQVIASYAQNLVNSHHHALLKQTKFENFIFNLQRSVGKPASDYTVYKTSRSARSSSIVKCISGCIRKLVSNLWQWQISGITRQFDISISIHGRAITATLEVYGSLPIGHGRKVELLITHPRFDI